MKRINKLVGIILIIFAGVIATSCEDIGPTPLATCDSCSSTHPWSVVGSKTCYTTSTVCLNAEGKLCRICT